MKTLTLILAFLPLIVFSVLARFLPHGYIGIAGLAAAVIALIAIVTSHPIWPPKILNTCSLVLFALIAVLGFTLGKNDDRWLATWGGAGVGLILGTDHPGTGPGHAVHRAVRPRIRPPGLLVLADLQEDQPRAQRRVGRSHLRRRRLAGSRPRPSTGTPTAACLNSCSAWSCRA